MEKKEGILKNVWSAIKSLGTDYNTEEKEIAKQVEELEKIQKQIHEEQKNFGASLRVPKSQTGKGKTQAKAKRKEKKQEEREIGDWNKKNQILLN